MQQQATNKINGSPGLDSFSTIHLSSDGGSKINGFSCGRGQQAQPKPLRPPLHLNCVVRMHCDERENGLCCWPSGAHAVLLLTKRKTGQYKIRDSAPFLGQHCCHGGPAITPCAQGASPQSHGGLSELPGRKPEKLEKEGRQAAADFEKFPRCVCRFKLSPAWLVASPGKGAGQSRHPSLHKEYGPEEAGCCSCS